MDRSWFRFARSWFRFGPLLLAAAVVAGCATGSRPRRLSSSVFHSARHVGRPSAAVPGPPAEESDESARIVVDRLHAAGFHFGTDGTPGALWGYMRTSHQILSPSEASPGDVVFFDTRSREGEERHCADRVGIVEGVGPEGRIVFMEARAGQMRRGYVDAGAPLRRRNDAGDILNSFLRPKRISDPDGTRYFAGEMLCGVARVRPGQ